jgi:hypothetical protein
VAQAARGEALVTVLDALLDSPLREAIFTEAKHKRGSKGTSQGGKFVSQGASGGGVQKIQRAVGATVDGAFGYNTRASVMSYQRAHGLKVDGVVGHQTAAAMLGHSNAKNVKPGALTAEDRKHFGSSSKTKTTAKSSKRKGTAPDAQAEARDRARPRVAYLEDLGRHQRLAVCGRIRRYPAGRARACRRRTPDGRRDSHVRPVRRGAGLDADLAASGEGADRRRRRPPEVRQRLRRPRDREGRCHPPVHLARQADPRPAADLHAVDARSERGRLLRLADVHGSRARRAGRNAREARALGQGTRRAGHQLVLRQGLRPRGRRAIRLRDGRRARRGLGDRVHAALVGQNPNLLHTSINAWPTAGKPGTHRGVKGMVIEGIRKQPQGSLDYVVRGGAGGRLLAQEGEENVAGEWPTIAEADGWPEEERAFVVSLAESYYSAPSVEPNTIPDLSKLTPQQLTEHVQKHVPHLLPALREEATAPSTAPAPRSPRPTCSG